MRDKVQLVKVNEVYLRVVAEPSIVQELADVFTFIVPGAKFMPAVRNRFWDGKIRLLNPLTGLTYIGLYQEIKKFCDLRGYELADDKWLQPDVDLPDLNYFFEDIRLKLAPRDYQLDAFKHAVANERATLISPTASGKSLIIFLLTQWFSQKKVLVIVPTTSLVFQMKTDFESYTKRKLNIHCITAGVDKETTEDIVISTWQSIYKMPKAWFNQFSCIIGDEVHQFKATSLKSIMEKAENTPYRFGFTGTLDGTQTNELTIQGLFGPTHRVTTTTQLMEQNHVAELRIKALILKHPLEDCKAAKSFTYQQEMDFITRNPKRNKFIMNLSLSLKGNSLVLFQYVDKHGKALYDMMKSKEPERDIFFIHGGINAEEREEVRGIVENHTNAIVVASYGTFSTGVNIRNLHNVVLASPSKSRIRILQSIGRGLRVSDKKDTMTLYDITDDIRYKTHTNFTLQHFSERLNIYNSEGFDYKIYNAEL